MSTIKMMTVAGARPQFVKVAIVSKFLRENPDAHRIQEILVHTGQHYDEMLSDVFFKDLNIQPPQYSLDVGSGPPGQQLGKMLERLEAVIREVQPDVTLVYGDTHSTLAAAIVSTHHNIPVVHVEAGERMYRRHDAPEEINRVITDNIASLCLTCTRRAEEYLKREAMADRRVRFVGDPMYEIFLWARQNVERIARVTPATHGLVPGKYHVATIHRAENTKSKELLLSILDALDRSELPVVLPIHPRVAHLIEKWDYAPRRNLKLIEPLGYFDFMRLMLDCSRVITDSGGVNREAFFARKPCIIPMDSSCWTEITESGWAICIGNDAEAISHALNDFTPRNEYPEGLFGDGQSAKHIVEEVTTFMEHREERTCWHPHGNNAEIPDVVATDFTHANYQKMLAELKQAGYEFIRFGDSQKLSKNDRPCVLLRHDVVYDLDKAVTMARIEAELGVTSTYFFMVRNESYNVFSKAGTAAINDILNCGHHLGLLIDRGAYPADFSNADLAKACTREAQMLSEWFGEPVEIVSYLRPDGDISSDDQSLSSPRLSSPLPHTGESRFTQEIEYCADALGRWRNGHPLDRAAFHAKKSLHILVHPIWWNETPTPGYPTLMRFIDQRRRTLENSLAANCELFRVGDRRAANAACGHGDS